MKLVRLEGLGHVPPHLHQRVAIHIRQLADGPHVSRKLFAEGVEQRSRSDFTHHDFGGHLLVLSGVYRPVQLDRQLEPPRYRVSDHRSRKSTAVFRKTADLKVCTTSE